jgi:hypothetical protein
VLTQLTLFSYSHPMTQTTAVHKATSRDRIESAAVTNGWTAKADGFGLRLYRKGTRYIRVYYGVRDQVIDAARQTGSYGGRGISGTGKADQIIALLAQDRWTK